MTDVFLQSAVNSLDPDVPIFDHLLLLDWIKNRLPINGQETKLKDGIKTDWGEPLRFGRL